MAQRVSPVAIPAPVAELVEAWNVRSADRFAASLAPDAQISVPPLHLELHGRDEVWDGVARLFGAFGALRYASRHRYLTADTVIDEALLEGLQTREFLGAPPPGRPGAVAARVMMRHNGRQITALTVWPDVAALRQLSAGMARRIDLRATSPAAPVVAALRATIPATESKLSIGQERQPAGVAAPDGPTLLPGAPPASEAVPGRPSARGKGGRAKGKDGKGKDKDGPKAPRSRSARRLRATAAAVLMLGLSGAVAAVVMQGVKGAKAPSTSAASSVQPGASPTGEPSRGTGSSSRPSSSRSGSSGSTTAAPKPTFDPKTNTFTIPNTILFELDSSALRPDARRALGTVVAALTEQKRYGKVVVSGYTDNTGTVEHNLQLSLQRAVVVRNYLKELLHDPRFTVVGRGYGEDRPVQSNDTAAGREKNRRVQIEVPKGS